MYLAHKLVKMRMLLLLVLSMLVMALNVQAFMAPTRKDHRALSQIRVSLSSLRMKGSASTIQNMLYGQGKEKGGKPNDIVKLMDLGPDFKKELYKWMFSIPWLHKAVNRIPPVALNLILSIYPDDLLLVILFCLTYRKILRFGHKMQVWAWKMLKVGQPYEYSKSILGFAEDRGRLLYKLIGGNYIVKLSCTLLAKLGFRIRSDLPLLISSVTYTMYFANFMDLFKSQFLQTFFPSISDRRQIYVANRFSSVAIWFVTVLVVCEMFSIYFKVPLSSTLAFGGVGGLALGLSARDIAANFLGGMLLLFNEPFTPGDMVTFITSSNKELIGRVERVGWGQTRIRGRDTRPTYVPNSHFVQTAVTNMERITHRKFQQVVPVRFCDADKIVLIIERIKARLKTIPKLDSLSMPLRVSFISIGQYSLDIQVWVYFATKSIDEFFMLQQQANIEIIAAIHECGADLAVPTTLITVSRTTPIDQNTAPGWNPVDEVSDLEIANFVSPLSDYATTGQSPSVKVNAPFITAPSAAATNIDSGSGVKVVASPVGARGGDVAPMPIPASPSSEPSTHSTNPASVAPASAATSAVSTASDGSLSLSTVVMPLTPETRVAPTQTSSSGEGEGEGEVGEGQGQDLLEAGVKVVDEDLSVAAFSSVSSRRPSPIDKGKNVKKKPTSPTPTATSATSATASASPPVPPARISSYPLSLSLPSQTDLNFHRSRAGTGIDGGWIDGEWIDGGARSDSGGAKVVEVSSSAIPPTPPTQPVQPVYTMDSEGNTGSIDSTGPSMGYLHTSRPPPSSPDYSTFSGGISGGSTDVPLSPPIAPSTPFATTTSSGTKTDSANSSYSEAKAKDDSKSKDEVSPRVPMGEDIWRSSLRSAGIQVHSCYTVLILSPFLFSYLLLPPPLP